MGQGAIGGKGFLVPAVLGEGPEDRPGAVAVTAGRRYATAARPAAVAPRSPWAPGSVYAFWPRPEGDTHPFVAPLGEKWRGE